VKAESGVNLGAIRPTLTGKRPTPAGAAIAGTHHIGISAIRRPVTMDQDVFRVTLSVIIAVAAAEHEAEAAMATDASSRRTVRLRCADVERIRRRAHPRRCEVCMNRSVVALLCAR